MLETTPADDTRRQTVSDLKPKTKGPSSVTVLTGWINQAEKDLQTPAGRLSWLVASTIVIATLQRALDASGAPRFLLKGGVLLQHRLGISTRATKDIDGLVRGDLDEFLEDLDEGLAEGWEPLTLRRTAVEVIDTPTRVIKPRRFDVILELRGKTFRRIQVEVAPNEGSAGSESETIPAPTLAPFGLHDPAELVGLSMRYQIAQKIHACTDPHDPPDTINDRVRDVVDLLLLRGLGQDLEQLRAAVVDVFSARAQDAEKLGRAARGWPTRIVAHPHWATDFERAARTASLERTLGEVIGEVNDWLAEIDAAR